MKARTFSLFVALLTPTLGRSQEPPEELAKRVGCFECHGSKQLALGPDFAEIAARYAAADPNELTLTLMSVEKSGFLPKNGKSLMILAQIGKALHVRIFDAKGEMVVDHPEQKLAQGDFLKETKATVRKLQAEESFPTKEQKHYLIQQAATITGFKQKPIRERLIDVVTHGGKGNWTSISKGVPMAGYKDRLIKADISRLVDWILRSPRDANLKVIKLGLGSGTVTSVPPGINYGADGDESYAASTSVTLTATPDAGSVFSHWEGDSSGNANTTTVAMSTNRSVRAVFRLAAALPALANFTPEGIQTYLTANPAINTPARFISILPQEYRQNWLLMTRSESLQTGTARSPRILLPSANALSVFTVGMSTHSSYPGSHPNAIEYMQWDPAQKNFRFHEIVLDSIPALPPGPSPTFAARSRGVGIDDNKCSKCHSTRNVLNLSTFPGTTGVTPGIVQVKNKPNWDAYDSWTGMLPFNRDRIYQGSVEAAAFRKIMNIWTWREDEPVRTLIDQLELQPPGVVAQDAITRTSGGANDGHINFAFDISPPVTVEPAPLGSVASINTNYNFDDNPGSGLATGVVQGGPFVTLRHTSDVTSDVTTMGPAAVEGRGVQLFDLLGGFDGNPNAERIADEVINHRFATGSVPFDPRPIAYAITRGMISSDSSTKTIAQPAGLTLNIPFFDARHGLNFTQIYNDTELRSQTLPRRKADLQKLNLDRTGDVYLTNTSPENGLIQEFGAGTLAGLDLAFPRLRQETFRRDIDLGHADETAMNGILVDREIHDFNTPRLALYRYFLEPLGVSVDKWSMGVRGRSRTYTFADVFSTYISVIQPALRASLVSNPVGTMVDPDNDAQLIAAINSTFAALPPANDIPRFTDVQRIFNKSCIECHGGLNYPPYSNYGTYLDLSEDETPPAGKTRLQRSWEIAEPLGAFFIQRVTQPTEACPYGMMPCGGPRLSQCDIETLRRWVTGGSTFTVGDPHLQTVNGVSYDFQGAGEYIFLRGDTLEMQVRVAAVPTANPLGPNGHTGLTSCVSVNTAVALRIGGQRITYQPSPDGQTKLQLRIDGKLREFAENERALTLAEGGRILKTTAPGGLRVEAPGGTQILITPGFWAHHQIWWMHINVTNTRVTEGLLGSIAPGNWLPALPDGSLLGPRPDDLKERHEVLYQKFGNAWRVSKSGSLFDYEVGLSTKDFTLENWPPFHDGGGCKVPSLPGIGEGKEPQPPIEREKAKQMVADIRDPLMRDLAIQDVMTTGEPEFAKVYLLADEILRRPKPKAPVLVGPQNFQEGVAQKLRLNWVRDTSASGKPLTYSFHVWPVGQPPHRKEHVFAVKEDAAPDGKTIAQTFDRIEPGKAYFWKVIAEDEFGSTAESEIRRFQAK